MRPPLWSLIGCRPGATLKDRLLGAAALPQWLLDRAAPEDSASSEGRPLDGGGSSCSGAELAEQAAAAAARGGAAGAQRSTGPSLSGGSSVGGGGMSPTTTISRQGMPSPRSRGALDGVGGTRAASPRATMGRAVRNTSEFIVQTL